jgi:hypothetical protein
VHSNTRFALCSLILLLAIGYCACPQESSPSNGGNLFAGTPSNPNQPTPTPISYTVPDSSYTCDADEVKFSRTNRATRWRPARVTLALDKYYYVALGRSEV